MTPTRVLVCDDFMSLRAMVRLVLELDGTFEVVGEARDGQEAIERAAELAPDIVLLDLSMPRKDGLEALPEIREAAPEASVVVYSGIDRAAVQEKALALGAAAFVQKGVSADELVTALRSLASGNGDARRLAG